MNGAKTIAWWLVIIGAVNWLLVGLGGFMGGANYNIVNLLLGAWPTVEWLVYVLVGLSGLWLLWEKSMGGKK